MTLLDIIIEHYVKYELEDRNETKDFKQAIDEGTVRGISRDRIAQESAAKIKAGEQTEEGGPLRTSKNNRADKTRVGV
jgi:hypothetical protein